MRPGLEAYSRVFYALGAVDGGSIPPSPTNGEHDWGEMKSVVENPKYKNKVYS